jgi:hypothetical protein
MSPNIDNAVRSCYKDIFHSEYLQQIRPWISAVTWKYSYGVVRLRFEKGSKNVRKRFEICCNACNLHTNNTFTYKVLAIMEILAKNSVSIFSK